MKILAIESSGAAASAAILEDENVIIEKTGPFKVTHSETLMPMISECFSESRTDPSDIDLIAVSGGPGSFTGLRIGSATAKGLGFALDKKLVHVPTLDAMALNHEGKGRVVIPIMDARRGQVYTGIYEPDKGESTVLMSGTAMSMEDLLVEINNNYQDREIVFMGDGVPVFADLIREKCAAAYELAEGEGSIQKASSVGRLGFRLACDGIISDAFSEAPEYLRPSQAERVREEKNGNQ